MRLSALACDIGKGLAAGFIGTVAITASQMIEMQVTKREPSSAPADAAGKVMGVQPVGEEEKQRFSQMVHIGYGTAWGAVRGVLAAMGLKGPAAMIGHFAAIFTAALVVPSSLGVSPPVTEWSAQEIAVDAVHHAVYALATNAVYEAMD
jgi:hypothetical protein